MDLTELERMDPFSPERKQAAVAEALRRFGNPLYLREDLVDWIYQAGYEHGAAVNY